MKSSPKDALTISGTEIVTSVAFTRDGSLLASGCADGSVWVWDVRDRFIERARLKSDECGWVTTVAFHPDGLSLASGGWSSTVSLWDVRSMRETLRLDHEKSQHVDALDFSADGATLATVGHDNGRVGQIRFWDTQTGLPTRIVPGPRNVSRSLRYSPDGAMLGCGSFLKRAGYLMIVDTESGVERAAWSGHSDAISSIAFSHHGGTVATGGEDSRVLLRDTTSGSVQRRLKGHTAPYSIVWLEFGLDDATLLSGSNERGEVARWDTRTGQLLDLATLVTDWLPRCFALSPDRRTLAVGTSGEVGEVLLYDFEETS